MQFYEERVLRYRILRHEELPERHKEALIKAGIDPDDNWSLIWSFNDKEAADRCLANEQADAASWQTYKLVDAGEETTIKRPIY